MVSIKNMRYIIICSLVLMISTTGAFCSAQSSDEEEEKFTGAEDIDYSKLNVLKNRSYDEAITIKEIDIKGNTLVPKETIVDAIDTKTGTIYNKNRIKDDLKKIYDMGYFTEKIKAYPEASPSGITLHITVEENIPVKGFDITGNKALSAGEILEIISPQSGLPQNLTELNKAVENIEKAYAEKGYILARVTRVNDDPDGIINLNINEGFIDEIAVSGNVKTKDYVITRNLTVKKGDIYNEIKLKQDLTRIFGTQAFSDVRRVVSPSVNDPDKYKLTIEVEEKRTGSISLGGGVDTQTGLFGQTGYVDNNFLGRGQELSLNLLIGSGSVLDDRDVLDRASYQFEANFIEPRFRQSLNSLQVNAFARDMASYQVPLSIERRLGGRIEVARPLKQIQNLGGSLGVGVETTKLREGDLDEITAIYNEKQVDITKRAEQLKGGTFLTLNPSLVYDTRNSILNTTDGWYTSANFKEYFAIFNSEAKTFGKATVGVRRFFPVGKSSTVTVGVKGGTKLIGTVPEYEAFRLGGPYSIRGYREGDVGNGEGFVMASAEFRTPIPFVHKFAKYKFFHDIRLAFFLDSGRLFDETLTNQLYDYPGYAVSFGAGVIVPIPMLGPLRFDYGYPITSVGSNNKKGVMTFGIGDRF